MGLLKSLLRKLLVILYKVEVRGMHHLDDVGDRALIVANHTSFLDALLLGVFLPDKLTFAVNTQVANNPWLKPFLKMVKIFPMDPTNPMSLKSRVRFVKRRNRVVCLPCDSAMDLNIDAVICGTWIIVVKWSNSDQAV